METLEVDWNTLKTIQASRLLSWQHKEYPDRYEVFVVDGGIEFNTVLFKQTASIAGGLTPQMVSDVQDFETNILPKSNQQAIDKRSASGRQWVTVFPPEGQSRTVVTHDWSDPTTWYENSIRVVDEVATNSGDNLTYNLSNGNVIDVCHGKILGEDFLKDSQGNSYRVQVKVNGVQKTEVDPHTGSGDYTVDYAAGKVTFSSALNPTDEVRVTYYYAGGSRFTIKPKSGEILYISSIRAVFTDNIDVRDTMRFVPYGLADVFAPTMVSSGQVASGTLIQLDDGISYKTFQDYVVESSNTSNRVQTIGGLSGNWRSSPGPLNKFEWRYEALSTLYSSYGMEIRIFLENDVPFGSIDGARPLAKAAFECFVEKEA